MAISNSFRGRCACGEVVQPGAGYVRQRKITCTKCMPPLPERQPPAFSVMYQGCADEAESLHEYYADNFENESHFLGWDVGSQ